MKDLKTAHIEQMNIENKISICRLNLKNIQDQMNRATRDEVFILLRKQLDREKRHMRDLKEKYPEHFI